MFEVLASIIYFPSIFVNLIGLFFGFVAVLNFSSFSIIHAAENFVFNRYSAITRRIHLPKHRTPREFTPSVCFMGGGQLWMFAIGVGNYVYKNYDIDRIKFLASSSGCFAAVPLACGLDPYDWCKRDWSKCIQHFEERGLLGCLYDTKHFYFNLWNDYLPEDAHIRCSGRLYISVTQVPSMRNKVISQFNNREELIWAIVGSICLPIVFIRDFPIKLNDEVGFVLDGGFSNDAPCLDSYTITVSALHRKADIKPEMKPPRCDNYYNSAPTTATSSDNASATTQAGSVPPPQSPSATVTPNKRPITGTLNGTLLSSNTSLPSLVDGLPPSGRKTYNTRSAARAAAPQSDEPRPSLDSDRDRDRDFDSNTSQSDSEEEGNLLVEAATEADKVLACVRSRGKRTSQTGIAALCAASTAEVSSGDAAGVEAEAAAAAAALKFSNRIRPIDIIRVPLYERVWEVGAMGQESAAKCLDFQRHEWASIKLKK
eukprot:CAMPEP_0184981058 /NCGR_PEP_ID=MMETSP1098-20130426/10912_1 /TAXON_ID=89044 /ORGANISM="Spumella elongata, Strain CCAP 955/1" /LENGTH=484 /DNA_ID=CAMNT_0027504579 /DNA_START=175 /DNA_END=1629 /DNA_ORIENTATION=+